jgi:hypothetical protein
MKTRRNDYLQPASRVVSVKTGSFLLGSGTQADAELQKYDDGGELDID